MGQLAAEYQDGTDTTPQHCTTCYLFADHLGSTRAMWDANGVQARYDYLPFGDMVPSDRNSRTSASCAPSSTCYGITDKLTQRFTSKERDAETGLDYFGARYMSSAQGRFTSPDPKQFSLRTVMNPQKWNKYAYTLNNPLALVDPDGKEEVTIQFRAFIPQANVAGFRGDNRSFSADANVRSRVSTTIRIETDPAKNGGNPLLRKQTDVGPTQLNITGQKKTSQGPMMPQVTATQDKNGNVTVNVQESMGNPFTSGVDPNGTIKSNMNITVNESATNAQFNGTVSGSPAFEANVSVNGSMNQNVPLQSAPANTVQFVLGLHSTNQINKIIELKKKEDPQ
jgi:RHS repeat-associated protein